MTGKLDRITFAPNVLGGRASLRGMRISVSLVVNLIANGMAVDEILREYPDLEAEDIRQALAYERRKGFLGGKGISTSM